MFPPPTATTPPHQKLQCWNILRYNHGAWCEMFNIFHSFYSWHAVHAHFALSVAFILCGFYHQHGGKLSMLFGWLGSHPFYTVFMCTYIREYLWTRLVCCLISEYKKQEVSDTVNCEAVDRFQKRLFFFWCSKHTFLMCVVTCSFYTQRTWSKIWCISIWDYILTELNWDMKANTVVFQKHSNVQILYYFILCHLNNCIKYTI